jgi:uncharacterized membrane protein
MTGQVDVSGKAPGPAGQGGGSGGPHQFGLTAAIAIKAVLVATLGWASYPIQWRNGRNRDMADLIAIGYPDETTATQAADEAYRLANDLIIQPDAIAVIIRKQDGSYQVHTNHGGGGGAGAIWGSFWGFLFGLLFFIPVLGMAIGAGMGAIMGHLTKSTIDKQFRDQVRDMLKPGTSALFLMVEKVTPDKAVEAMSKYGGTVLKTSLSKEDEQALQAELHGTPAG